MSKPKLERNFDLIKLRLSDPEKWSIEKLRVKFKFKSKATVHEILETFTPKYKAYIAAVDNSKRSK